MRKHNSKTPRSEEMMGNITHLQIAPATLVKFVLRTYIVQRGLSMRCYYGGESGIHDCTFFDDWEVLSTNVTENEVTFNLENEKAGQHIKLGIYKNGRLSDVADWFEKAYQNIYTARFKRTTEAIGKNRPIKIPDQIVFTGGCTAKQATLKTKSSNA